MDKVISVPFVCNRLRRCCTQPWSPSSMLQLFLPLLPKFLSSPSSNQRLAGLLCLELLLRSMSGDEDTQDEDDVALLLSIAAIASASGHQARRLSASDYLPYVFIPLLIPLLLVSGGHAIISCLMWPQSRNQTPRDCEAAVGAVARHVVEPVVPLHQD
jgi:hypothetical protein